MTIHSDIDKIFKDGLSDYSQRPPGFVWDNIEQELNKNRFKKRRNILYAVAASVALILSFGAGILFNNSENQSTYVAQVQSIEQNQIQVENKIKPNQQKTSNKETSISENTNNNKSPQKVETKTSASKKEKNKSVNKKPIKQTTKKVSSEGVLLPPMFASNNNYNTKSTSNSSEERIKANNNLLFEEDQHSETLEKIKKQKIELASALEERDLKYEYRQLPMYVDYSLADNEAKTSNWSVGVNASPLISYREVNNVEKEALTTADIISNYENQYQNEKPLVSYSAGVDVNYNITSRLKVQSGVYFSELGQISKNVNINKNNSYYSSGDQFYAINTSMGNVNIQGSQNQLVDQLNPSPGDFEIPGRVNESIENNSIPDLRTNFVQTFEYYEIPLILNYKVIDRKLGVSMSGGFSANILYNSNTQVEDEGIRYNLNADAKDINNFSYNGILGLGFDYPIISQLFFNLQPTFRYSINSLSESNDVHPYSFGVYTGLRYNF